jgi:hypothetical protein
LKTTIRHKNNYRKGSNNKKPYSFPADSFLFFFTHIIEFFNGFFIPFFYATVSFSKKKITTSTIALAKE